MLAVKLDKGKISSCKYDSIGMIMHLSSTGTEMVMMVVRNLNGCKREYERW